jgi:IclR family mhp operon transcriptional activator
MEKGVPIRSISRCVSVLQAINRAGDLSLMEIAKTAKVPYPTACRIVQTLLHEQLIEREPTRKHYRPTALIQSLSNGFQVRSQLVAVAREHIVALTKKHGWPISIATRVGPSMVIRDSTHALTYLTFNNYAPGYMLPILESAAGKAYLAYADADERDLIIRELRASGGTWDFLTMKMLESGDLVDDIRKVGYAVKGRNRFTETPGKTFDRQAAVRSGRGCRFDRADLFLLDHEDRRRPVEVRCGPQDDRRSDQRIYDRAGNLDTGTTSGERAYARGRMRV